MENIFEGAKFGDKFLTRGGEIAIFWCISDANEYSLISDITERILVKRQDGLDIDFDESFMDEQDYLNTDIVSRYKEPIDEKKLDELANNEDLIKVVPPGQGMIKKYGRECFKAGFKSGYLKANEK